MPEDPAEMYQRFVLQFVEELRCLAICRSSSWGPPEEPGPDPLFTPDEEAAHIARVASQLGSSD
jgi:hypothetical protein